MFTSIYCQENIVDSVLFSGFAGMRIISFTKKRGKEENKIEGNILWLRLT